LGALALAASALSAARSATTVPGWGTAIGATALIFAAAATAGSAASGGFWWTWAAASLTAGLSLATTRTIRFPPAIPLAALLEVVQVSFFVVGLCHVSAHTCLAFFFKIRIIFGRFIFIFGNSVGSWSGLGATAKGTCADVSGWIFTITSIKAWGFLAYELIEIALLTIRSLVLDEKSQIAVIELLEPFVPGNFVERTFAAVARKVEADYANVVAAAGAAHASRLGAALLCPAANLLVIG
jgi:hypothetical protein